MEYNQAPRVCFGFLRDFLVPQRVTIWFGGEVSKILSKLGGQEELKPFIPQVGEPLQAGCGKCKNRSQ